MSRQVLDSHVHSAYVENLTIFWIFSRVIFLFFNLKFEIISYNLDDMERIVLISAVLMAIIFELCSAAGAFAQQPNSRDPSSRVDEMVQREMAQINEAQYAANNLETIMQLLAERDAQESEWRRQEALDRENARAELAKQKRDFHYYGARGKKALASAFAEQKRFQYMPSRG